jgi:argininosuccinate synthase
VYETPGGAILLAAHRAMESITLDRGAYEQKDAAGFIKLNALRLRTLAMRKRKSKS